MIIQNIENGEKTFGVPPISVLFQCLEKNNYENLSISKCEKSEDLEELTNSTTTEEDEEEEEEEGEEESSGSESVVDEENKKKGNSVDIKKKRVMRKCAEIFDRMTMSQENKIKGMEIAKEHLKSIEENKMKKSARSLTAGLVMIVCKKLSHPIDSKCLGKMIPRTDRHFKSRPETGLSISTDSVCISRIANSLEKKQIGGHHNLTIQNTIELIKQFNMTEIEKKNAIDIANFSDHPHLASRHALSIAAASICISSSNISVNSVAKVSKISSTTIRKTISAIKLVFKN